MSRLLFVTPLVLFVSLHAAFSQPLEISGEVVARATNEPLVAANIHVKGTQLGTTTDLQGRFTLTLPDVTEATLVVSYIGYKRVDMPVTESTTELRISLDQDILKTSEVVVTGFASSVKRENLANAVATLSARELISAPAQTIEQALAGKLAGVSISQNTGAPGGGINVNLRGVSTIEGPSQPLFVVDGVIVNNAAIQSGIDVITEATGAGSANPQGQPTSRIADVNPNEIQTIEVLKGASAAALYGSKATNGVILITTKRATPGPTRIDVSHQVGVNSLLNKIGSRRFTRQLASETYGSLGDSLFVAGGGQFIDYEDVMYGQNGLINETSIGAGGGNEQTQYYVSGLSRSEDGIIKNTGYGKQSGRINLHHLFSDRLRMNAQVGVVRSESDRAITGNDNTNTTLGFSLAFTPSFFDIQPRNGVYPLHPFNPSNPIHTRDVLTNNETVYRTIGTLLLHWNMYRDDTQILDFIAQTGYDFFNQENQVISPPELQFEQAAGPSVAGASLLARTNSVNSNLYLNLAHSLSASAEVAFKTTGGVQVENQDVNWNLTEARGLTPTQTNIDQAASLAGYQDIRKQRELGFYIQEEVNIEDKYFLTAGLRGDASSVNANTDKFFLFPKASGSVRLSQFDFWDPLSQAVSEFKIRLAYGETGNLASPDAKFTTLEPRNIGGVGGLVPGTRRGASDIRFEQAKELETGFDATLFDENATVEFSYYQKNVSDLLLIHSLPASSGFTDEWINGGKLQTEGVEVSVGVTPFRDEFGWTSRLNFYRTTSEITQLDVPAFNKGGFAPFLGTYRIQEGWSPTTIVGAERDAAGNLIPLGNETPDFTMSWINSLSYANFELNFLWEWKSGGDVINLGKLITDLGGTSEDYDELAVFNVGGRDTTMKKGIGRSLVTFFQRTQTGHYVEDGSYIKLREARLTYSFPQETVRDLLGGLFTYLRVGIAGRNLLVFTDYTGYDPEVSQFGSIAIGRSIDTLPYPSSRSFYFNLAFGL